MPLWEQYWQKIKDLSRKVEAVLMTDLSRTPQSPLWRWSPEQGWRNWLQEHSQKKDLYETIEKAMYWVALGFFVLSLAICVGYLAHEILSLQLHRALNLYDEGVTLMGAHRIHMGEVIYRDFWTMYMPGKFWVLSAVFDQWGSSVDTARIYQLWVSMAAVGLIALILRHISGMMIYGLCASVIVILYGNISMSMVFMLLSTLVFLCWMPRKQWWMAGVLGIVLGGFFLWRWDFGGFYGLTVSILGTLWIWQGIWRDGERPIRAFNETLMYGGMLILGWCMVFLPAMAYLQAQGALENMIQYTVLYPIFGEYQGLRELPWQSVWPLWEMLKAGIIPLQEASYVSGWWWFVLPLVAGGLSLIRGLIAGSMEKREYGIALLMAGVVAAYLYVSHRADYGHTLFLSMNATVLALAFIGSQRNMLGGFVSPLLILGMAVSLYAPAKTIYDLRTAIQEGGHTAYSWSQYSHPTTTANAELEQVLERVRNMPADTKVYVGLSQLDQVHVNNVVLPYLLPNTIYTTWHELHTGIVTQKEAQEQIIQEIQQADYVITWNSAVCEPNLGCLSTGRRDFEEYFREEYEFVEQYGNYFLYGRALEQ